MDEVKNAVEILRKARHLITSQDDIAKGEYLNPDSKCFCTAGAIFWVLNVPEDQERTPFKMVEALWGDIPLSVLDLLQVKSEGQIYEFNDANTREDVIAWLTDSIDRGVAQLKEATK